jgi:hypothetical protein
MARPIMLRSVARLLLSALVTAPLLSAPSAEAQPSPEAVLRLGSQTPWNSTSQPELDLTFSATNVGGAAVGDLSLGVVVFSRVLTRSAYESSLVRAPAIPIHAQTLPREGVIAPGETREFNVALTLSFYGIDRTQSGIYPLEIQLRSHDVPIATLRTPVIFLVRKPLLPLQFSWTFVLDHPIDFRPDGVFVTAALESALAPGGRLNGEIRALVTLVDEPDHPPVDVVVSPRLLIQLARMRSGYTLLEGGQPRSVKSGTGGAALAAAALADLRHIAAAPHVELSALPFSAPEVPSLLSGGLARDVTTQIDRGAGTVQTLLGVTPDASVFRPPNGALDEEAVSNLAARGVRVLLLDPGAVEQPPDRLGFALPPTAAVGDPDSPTAVVLPDQAVSALSQQPLVALDPVLGAQAVLGELAAIWQEQPGVARGVAVSFPGPIEVPSAFYLPFVRAAATAPWLAPVSARALAASSPPSAPQPLSAPATGRFDVSYVGELKQARRRVETLKPMLVNDTETPARMETDLLLAESSGFLTNPTQGLAFVRTVRAQADAIFDGIHADTAQPVTLTSRTGARIPLRVTNDAARALRVRVSLQSPHLASSPSQGLVLEAGRTTTLTFPVDLRTNGRFEVFVRIQSPNGRVIAHPRLIVRSTAFNRVALVITLAAAAMLLILWARRFVPRRTS